MRIERLDLTRFGGFTDRSLDLAGDGVHVIVGANETGKTTAMAAIRQLLYGIPIQSSHDYLHSYQDMRIGARLRIAGGEVREIVRLKRNSNALRDPSDSPIDESTLASWLYDVDQSLYGSLFEISHQEIASGGDALLESDGDLGRAVFSASRGTTDLNTVLRKLDERADESVAGHDPLLPFGQLRSRRLDALKYLTPDQQRVAFTCQRGARRSCPLELRVEIGDRTRVHRERVGALKAQLVLADRGVQGRVLPGPLVEPVGTLVELA